MKKKNLLIPQAFVQYQLISSSKKANSSKSQGIKKSSFGSSPLQTLIPLAKIIGPYQPTCVVAKATVPTKQNKKFRLDQHFLNIENHKLSLLVPEIRLYRYYEETKEYKPFYFPTINDFNFSGDDKIDFSKPFSANSAVIKSFSVDFLGANPYQAGLGMLTATLQIDVDSLTTIFDTPDDSYAELADLILMRIPESKKLPGANKTTSASALKSGKSLPIVATLGYSFQDKENIFTSEEKKAIESTKMMISLYYNGHNISFQQNGAASISANYHGNLEAANEDFIYNLLEKPNIKKKTLEITASVNSGTTKGKKANAKDINKSTPSKKEEEKQSKPGLAKLEKTDHIGSILDQFLKVFDLLHSKEKLHASLYNNEAGFHEFNDALVKEKKTSNATKLVTASPDSTELVGKNEVSLGAQTPQASTSTKLDPFAIFDKCPYIFYVNFGDLVDALMAKLSRDIEEVEAAIKKNLDDKKIEKAEAESQRKELANHRSFLANTNILFADASYRVKGSKEERTINIADIPVSTDLIYTAIYEDYVKPKKYFMGLKEILVSFCLKLLNKSMRAIPGADLLEKTLFRTSNLSGHNLKGKIKEGEINVNQIKTLKPATLTKKSKALANIIIFHQERCETTSTSGRNGNVNLDYQEGILHIRTSQDRGLVKTINYSQMQVPGRVEYATVGHGDGYEALRIPQNATVEMYGNTIFLPTMEVYIDPDSMGFGDPRNINSAARRLGLGGYYAITKVSLSFSGGVLNTSLQCAHAGYPDTAGQPKRTDKAQSANKEVSDIRKAAGSHSLKSKKK